MSKRRKFSAEFKRGAVEQASQSSISCAQVAREVGYLAKASDKNAIIADWLVRLTSAYRD